MQFFPRIFPLCFALVACLHADLDWGGGSTLFEDSQGVPFVPDTGLAVLASSIDGAAPDIENIRPSAPERLILPGEVFGESGGRFRVLATSSEFYSGYLLNSAIPDLDQSTQENLGVSEGERLYLIVWDRRTFVAGLPTDDSRFTLLPLFQGGDDTIHATTFGDGSRLFAEVCHPEDSVAVARATSEARYCGFHRFADFADWLAKKHGYADATGAAGLDPDRDGRTFYQEYAFEERPSVETGEAGSAVVASLRASDAGLAYAVEMSPDLNEWSRCELHFDGERWQGSDERIVVRRNEYLGNGVWAVSITCNESSGDAAMFYRFVVPGADS